MGKRELCEKGHECGECRYRDLREQYERLREAAKRMVAADEAITELCEQADCGWPDELEWSFNQLKVALSDAPTAPERRTED